MFEINPYTFIWAIGWAVSASFIMAVKHPQKSLVVILISFLLMVPFWPIALGAAIGDIWSMGSFQHRRFLAEQHMMQMISESLKEAQEEAKEEMAMKHADEESCQQKPS